MPTTSAQPKAIRHIDVTGVPLHFTEQDILNLAKSMEPEQRRYLSLVAETVTAPSEIWRQWVRDPRNEDGWVMKRTYLRIVRTAEQELTGDAVGIAIDFFYVMRWQLSGVHLLPSSYANVVANMNEDLRQGELMYPLLQVKGGESA
jgi:phage-Barnase-EndoU-ColicinE5/D-RelE like nuclease2